MSSLDLIRDLEGTNGNINTVIFQVLLSSYPLTARQIYLKIKKNYGFSSTYQAVHKRLQILEKDNIVKKEGLDYFIDKNWLMKIDEFSALTRQKMIKRDHELRRLSVKNDLFEKKNNNVKVISFDLGGAFFNNQFDELLWRTEIPKIYAQKYNLSKEVAFERVTSEYRRLWGKVDGWRDPEFWLKHFKLDIKFSDIIKNIKISILPYSDAAPIIKILQKKYHLIIISHAQENILLMKLKLAGYEKIFLKIYSVGSHFRKITKDEDIYQDICDDLRVKPEEIVHIGNNFDFDYKVPSSIGINAFLIDRTGFKKEPFVVRDLYEFQEKIRDLEAEA